MGHLLLLRLIPRMRTIIMGTSPPTLLVLHNQIYAAMAIKQWLTNTLSTTTTDDDIMLIICSTSALGYPPSNVIRSWTN